MMEASIEEGRAPLTLAEGGGSIRVVGVAERKLVARWALAAALYAVVDVVLCFLVFISPFGFSLSDAMSKEVGQYSVDSSIFDWLLIAIARDVLFAGLALGALCKAPSVTAAGWARRVAVVFVLVALYRLTLLNFIQTPRASEIFTPTLVLAGISSAVTFLLGDRLFKASEALEKVVEEGRIADGGAVQAGADSQYSSALTFWQTLKVLKPYFWPSTGTWKEVTMNRARASMTWFFVGLSKVCNLISPIFLGSATNEIAALLKGDGSHEVTTGITVNLVMYAAMVLLSKILKEAQSLVYIKVQQAAYIEIADTTFAHLHSLSVDWHVRKKGGNVIRSIDRGVAAAQNTMQYCFLNLVPTLAEAVAVTLIFIFKFKNARLAVFVGLNLYLYGYATIKITLWRKRFREATTKNDNESHDRLLDSLVNYETVKYFTAEEYEREEYTSIIRKFQKFSMATQQSLSFLNILQQLIVNFALGGGMILATQKVLEEHGSLGDFVAVNVYIINVFTPLNFLGTIYNMVVNALVDMKNFGQLLAEPSDIKDEPHAPHADMAPKAGVPIIEFRDVRFQYDKQPLSRGIKGVSFKVERGKSVALVGTSGAGKTTVTRLLFRFYDVTGGQVLLNGQDVRKITQHSLREAIGMVPQDTVMFNAPISHNIRYGLISKGREISHAQVEKAAKQAQLDVFVEQQPLGYETVVGERGLKLSGGEKQRLAIARCFLKDPPIVVLDEATSALDSATEQRVQQALEVLSNERTVIAIAHRLSTIKHFNEILVFENGEVIERGTHTELMATTGSRYSDMWKRQAEGIFDESPSGPSTDASPDSSSTGAGLGMANGHGGGHGGGKG
eukprot:CAMPEP_0177176972 /NCGR_PEP_ID=MMETSP0367-20130122/13545_1 /TAXON_ID=447022 ORGANISM="Scrippsiella hangoei-like, Strain SHHI-4" /NCGR_SAMPLE_ID=MMETSP0367 /ASSEMBLY_ACC=CAM_ASM_000362 /LENGTH=843 /DNA_ID=CAMNT_0018623529 /DNA_START=80 /DNA_END=2608 /DNA_ORIENTATION=+